MVHMTNNELLKFKKHRPTSCFSVLHDKLIDSPENLVVFTVMKEGETMEEWKNDSVCNRD